MAHGTLRAVGVTLSIIFPGLTTDRAFRLIQIAEGRSTHKRNPTNARARKGPEILSWRQSYTGYSGVIGSHEIDTRRPNVESKDRSSKRNNKLQTIRTNAQAEKASKTRRRLRLGQKATQLAHQMYSVGIQEPTRREQLWLVYMHD